MNDDIKNLTQLGSNTAYKYNCPDKMILESFSNVNSPNIFIVDFKCNEFTSLCPKTGQPDFGLFYIRYIPDDLMVESKSLKLYLFSYRNEGSFHETITNRICNDLFDIIKPHWIRVIGDFNPRGGISITTIVEKKKNIDFVIPVHYLTLPENIHLRH